MQNIYGITPDLGLHGLIAERILSRPQLADKCSRIVEILGGLIAATEKAAPSRKRNFQLDNKNHGKSVPNERSREARLERAIIKMECDKPGATNIGDICNVIHSYQVPLRAFKEDLSASQIRNTANALWARLDLMGTTSKGYPVVLELKHQADNPVHMIVEAAKYGVAIKKIWGLGMSKEWQAVFQASKLPQRPDSLKGCQLICIAPRDYWEKWFKDHSQPDLFKNIDKLCAALSRKGFPVAFATFDSTEVTPEALPIISNLQIINTR